MIETATKEISPHPVENFRKDCDADLHGYYNDTKWLVDNEDEKRGRLSLIYAVQNILKNGLYLLGISAPEKM